MSAVLEKPEVKRSPTAHPTRFHLAEAVNQGFVFNAEVGITPKDIVLPGFWTHIAEKLTPYDKIEVRAENGDWIAFLLVTACDRNWARVHLLSEHQLNASASAPVESIRHKVEWKGPQLKFCVIRLSDDAKVQDGFQNKEAAGVWLREHERTVQ